MFSSPQSSCTMVAPHTLLLGLACCILAPATAEKVHIDLFYESLCPYSIE